MAFKVVNASIDVINGVANVAAIDQAAPGGHPRAVNVQFPFNPPSSEAAEKDRVIAEAKKVLQQALSEL